MIERARLTFGREWREQLECAARRDAEARGALESSFYGLNHRHLEGVGRNWSTHPLAQLNNPLGRILHGGEAIVALCERVFTGPVRVQVTFGKIVEYVGADHAVFAGRQTGTYAVAGQSRRALSIRISRYFRYAERWWRQFDDHGSIDDPDTLRARQDAVPGEAGGMESQGESGRRSG